MANLFPDDPLLKAGDLSAAADRLTDSIPDYSNPKVIAYGVVSVVVGYAFNLMHGYYVGLLIEGSAGKGRARRRYDEVRESLLGENRPARYYALVLRQSLDWLDRFIGDGAATPPSWTMPAFEYCLLLALFFPATAILLVWGFSGRIGAAESALALTGVEWPWRVGLILILAWMYACFWIAKRLKGPHRIISGTGAILAFLAVMTINATANSNKDAGATVAVAIIFTTILFYLRAPGGSIALVFISVFILITGEFFWFLSALFNNLAGPFGIITGPILLALIFAVPMRIGVAVVTAAGRISDAARNRGRQGLFLALLLPGLVAVCFMAAALLPSQDTWTTVGPSLLFFVLLPVINAPFNWVSLGLTRALLRQGLVFGGWWPFVLAIADMFTATGIIVALALTMVVGVQAFDDLAMRAGATEHFLPLDALLAGIKSNPASAEYWWIYALLLSTAVPSLVNLMIGGASLMRGVPVLSAWLRQRMPENEAIPKFEANVTALVLTGQSFVGMFLGMTTGVVMIAVVIGVIPAVGPKLLDTAQAVAGWDWPGRILDGIWL